MKKSLIILSISFLAFACSPKAPVEVPAEADNKASAVQEKGEEAAPDAQADNKKAEEAEAKAVVAPDSEENKAKDLAVDPKTCKVTHCKTFPGFEDNGLECTDSNLLRKDGYQYGDQVLKAQRVKHSGAACEVKETEPLCFIGLYGLRRDISKYGVYYCDPRNCVVEDFSECGSENSKKDLAVDPKTCKVTHCKSFPGFEDNGLACDTAAIVKAGYELGDEVLHIHEISYGEDEVCDTKEGELSEACFKLKTQCFLNPKQHAKAVNALGWDMCEADCILIK